MAFEKLQCTIAAEDNVLVITPVTDIIDNSIYTIKITGLKSKDGSKKLPDTTYKVVTAVSPQYCTLASLKAVTQNFNISDETMMIYIREASAYADFIATATATKASGSTLLYAKGELTKVKATIDCLTNSFVSGSFMVGGNRYKLGEDELEEGDRATAFKNFLDWLKWLLKYWEDAVRGYFNPGKAPPQATRLGISASDNNDVAQITVDSLVQDFTRDVPQWS